MRRRRTLNIVLVTAALAAVAMTAPYLLRKSSRDWTTKSPEALQAFQAGLDARMRFYLADAATSFRKALELDPEFAAAKLQLADLVRDDEERKRLRQEIEKMDLSRLNERERFLIELARGKHEEEQKISARFLASHPQDPWALSVAAGQAWSAEDWTAAAALYARLLDVDPNWVLARNNLGYMAMAQARFADAEEQFRTYAYVAPDQANPHDSLGELLSLVGRYAEARSELERALAIRPDFCASYEHLFGIAVFEGRPEEMPPVIARVGENCPPKMKEALVCEHRFFAAFIGGDFDAPWRDGFASCAGKAGNRGPLFHRMALLAGKGEEAAAEEAALARSVLESQKAGYGKGRARMIEAESLHARGVRKLAEGDASAAVALFREADERASYWGVGEGRLKLFNLLNLALALERAGAPQEAEAALAKVRAVNPPFASTYPAIAERSPARL